MIKKLKHEEIGSPKFKIKKITADFRKDLTLFHLSSHHRAKDALEFGLNISEHEFNIYVLSSNRSGRLMATLGFVREYLSKKPAVDEWVYLNNFSEQESPLPYQFPSGTVKEFQRDLLRSVERYSSRLFKLFNSESFLQKIKRESRELEDRLQEDIEALSDFAHQHNIELVHTDTGIIQPVLKERHDNLVISDEDKAAWYKVGDRLLKISNLAEEKLESIGERVAAIKANESAKILKPIILKLKQKYNKVNDLKDWINSLEVDLLNQVDIFIDKKSGPFMGTHPLFERYQVNMMSSCDDSAHPPMVVEPNPTFENLFGSIKYRATAGGYITNYTMILPGSLHRANGGVLVLRADALAQNPDSWKYLKDAIRDREIRIEEMHRANMVPVLEAPKPVPIPLNVKIILIGAPIWFYMYYYQDIDFLTYFKVKADIDQTMHVNQRNLEVYKGLLEKMATEKLDMKYDEKAIDYLIGHSSRIAGDREKISAKFEAISDILCEAKTIANNAKVQIEHVRHAIYSRETRDSRVKEHALEMIKDGTLILSTRGKAIGQINALTVASVGEYRYGLPSRVSASTSIGKAGVVSIEKVIDLSGPIQHKGVLILEGYLKNIFAQEFPISFSSSITFEQNYGSIEGDSASMAELCCLISSLAKVPIDQSIAITGAINQFGDVEAIGGAIEKIEGFYEVCKNQGFTGSQGVIVPKSNEKNIILRSEVVAAIKEGKFHLWSVTTVYEALEILTGVESGHKNFKSKSGANTIYGKAYSTLKQYNDVLNKKNKGSN